KPGCTSRKRRLFVAKLFRSAHSSMEYPALQKSSFESKIVNFTVSFLTKLRFIIFLLVVDTSTCYKHSAWRHFTPIEKARNALERIIQEVSCQMLLFPYLALIVILLLQIYSKIYT